MPVSYFSLMEKSIAVHTLRIIITGLIQGIGFRPFIYTIAQRYGIHGYVRNRSDAAEIVAQGDEGALERFRSAINAPPALARIDSLTSLAIDDDAPYSGFTIRESEDSSDGVTDISPDIAVCEQCLSDLKEQPHRIGYPLINCTLCGPRFSIIRSVPYDRRNTTMAPFALCATCALEYGDPADRRFHAQPIACNACGPVYRLRHRGETFTAINDVLSRTASLLEEGAIAAIKGTGGFHLACNPFDTDAVRRLRSGKRRDGKPFALMFRDIAAVRRHAWVNDAETSLLQSAMRPIVLLRGMNTFPPEVNNRLTTVGAMLPSMPFHYLLFERLSLRALIMTSGNISEEPIVIDNEAAAALFAPLADAVVTYNRAIHNRVDDSVCAVYGEKVQMLRRSRGFAPAPINLPWKVDGIAATGAELKNCFALGKGSKAILSQHIGDLKNSETLQFFEEAYGRLCMLMRVKPSIVAHDLHPDYLSTMFARKTGLPLIAVQHHHAHIASCCAEHGIARKVIGVALDGTGYGTDGAVWGGEFLIADMRGFERAAHLRYVGMPGGDRAAVEPWRMAAAYLYDCFGEESFAMHRDLVSGVHGDKLAIIAEALRKGINCPQTSSAGRLFDAVASLCGLCNEMTFEAEAAMRLEAACGDALGVKPYQWRNNDGLIDLRETIGRICDDRRNRVSIDEIVTRFHATIIAVIVETCARLRGACGIDSVVLSGGCFQNRCIFEAAVRRLQENGFIVYTHHLVPCNDGAVALGQLAVAAHLRSEPTTPVRRI
ncbi:MAG: carbamoyltransferase HypF [Chitinispirillaceae bacterium]|nr:carbamoyltransferase HypF [Chitinispirillaceae bacterium]